MKIGANNMRHLSTKMCMTRDIGVHGNLFGGSLISWLDEVAATWSCDLCRNPNMVTVKINEMVFQRPVKVGNQVSIYGKVKDVGNSSITLYIEAKTKNFYSGEEELVCSTIFIFVRIGDNGKATNINPDVKENLMTLI
ncbi:acyl-CoA thioesterase [Putridiphycobacter roseus]|uniref:Acyl-CoA thioesterase n=1 Tax=Putridiphycobacter roseus TaxID=2219161 RepID=A0A2W1MV71_9FLAO|nr:hotdog domain-containing protein [Putridiphycobacter roseus]PZE15717.1 acyl-CoA thioesterase [Putridiphycobacter roseus]